MEFLFDGEEKKKFELKIIYFLKQLKDVVLNVVVKLIGYFKFIFKVNEVFVFVVEILFELFYKKIIDDYIVLEDMG